MDCSSDSDTNDIMIMKNFNLKEREQNQVVKQKKIMRQLNISKGEMANSASNSNSKSFALGIARRPSDNLLLKFNQVSISSNNNTTIKEEQNENSRPINLSDLSPPNKQFVTKNQRPISDDSIGTKTSELFSSPSFEIHSRDSSIGNDIEVNDTSLMDKSSIISEEDTTLIIHQNKNTNNTIDISSGLNPKDLVEKPLPPSPQKPTYFFNNAVDTSGNSTPTQSTISTNTPNSTNNNNTIQNHQSSYIHSNKSAPLLKGTNHKNNNHNNNNNNNNNNHNTNHNSTSHVNINNNPHMHPHSNNNNMERRETLPNNIYHNTDTGKRFPMYNHSNSTTAISSTKGPLTASQRYRLRKEQNETSIRKTIKQKERFYEDQERSMELQEGDIDDSLIWNIPMASLSTSSFLTSSTATNITPGQGSKMVQEQHQHQFIPPTGSFLKGLDFFEMPPSPIPGVSKVSDFQYFQNTTKNLTDVYIHSSDKLSKSKLSERTNSANFLPLDLKEASEKGMEDLLLVSENKLELMSNTRPSWLPPKNPEEKREHEKQISKSLSMASIEQLDRNKDREQRLIKDETNRQKFVLLLDRDVTRNSSIKTLQKIIWETSLSIDVRFTMYSTILQSDVKLITQKYLEPFTDLLQIVNGMDFPKGKEAELDQLISKSIRTKRNGTGLIPKDLMLMLKIKSISTQGLLAGDELLFHHFLQDESFKTLSEVWEAVNLLQMTCFNDMCQEKYDTKIIAKNSVMANYLLRNDDFKDEFNSSCLNFNTWWNILERVDHELFMWIMDIIVVYNAQCFKNDPVKQNMFKDKDWDYYKSKKVNVKYKILLSFVLNILLNYHFGFIDLKTLADLDDEGFCIPIPMDDLIDKESVNGLLIRKWLHYNKKF